MSSIFAEEVENVKILKTDRRTEEKASSIEAFSSIELKQELLVIMWAVWPVEFFFILFIPPMICIW